MSQEKIPYESQQDFWARMLLASGVVLAIIAIWSGFG